MKKTILIIAYAAVVIAVAWSCVAIGNGKVGKFFGVDVFIAAKDDMMLALVLNMVAAVGLVIIGATRLATRNHPNS